MSPTSRWSQCGCLAHHDVSKMKTLSSPWTIVNKVLLPIPYFTILGFVLLAVFVDSQNWERENLPSLGIPLVFVLFSPVIYICGSRLKWVYETEEGFQIRGYFRAISVPYDKVARVSNPRIMTPERIQIDFSVETPFGKSVQFMPQFRWNYIPEHPIVEILKKRIDANQTVDPSPFQRLVHG
jgi:hypothetical protein